MESATDGLSVYDAQSPLHRTLHLPISRWSDKPAPTFVVRVVQGTCKNAILILSSFGERLGFDARHLLEIVEDRWAPHVPFSRLISVAITTTLPGAFLIFIRNHPRSWAARHQTKIANALHVLALVTIANQKLSIQDLLVTAFVMVSFEALQRITNVNDSDSRPAVETLLSQTHSVVARSDINGSPQPQRIKLARKHSSSNPESTALSAGCKDAEIDRLLKRLAESKTSEKAREVDLKRTKADLQNARATLNETFAEYASLRDELKTMKQTLGRDHQSVIYRKDIELFALRKANEQKENYIKDRETKLEEIHHRHKVALDLRDAELKNLKDRIVFLERQESPRFGGETKVDSATESDSQAALQIKFLRVKGRKSTEKDEQTVDEKDSEIAKLKADLADATTTSEALNSTQIELRRAWDATSEVQQALNDERQHHVQTQENLREAALKIEELKNDGQKNFPSQLTTIPEQNAQELEAMFNNAQQDNLRLYGEVEALDKRVREANARIFSAESTADALREQLRLEKAINEDMETARPSIVHRVHFQRMEGQLKESRDELDAKDAIIHDLKKAAAEKDAKVDELTKQKENSTAELKEENERLKQEVKELETTKHQLMLDHERLALHRARTRTTSAEHHTSARSSGATLITDPPTIIPSDPIPPIPISTSNEDDPPFPARPISIAPLTPTTSTSIQGTPERHIRQPTLNRLSMISNDVPPAELRHKRHKSLTLKGLMRKITRKDDLDEQERATLEESPRPKTALMPKDKNALMRPKTAAPTEPQDVKKRSGKARKEQERPRTSAAPSSSLAEAKMAKEAKEAKRYYSDARPKTSSTAAAGAAGEDNAESARPKSRGWAAS
ncbi:hypothetical protein N0V90_011184 [Kalmusia sp. IMI 367209]|nr:hypothetical protein N0V90_011184 [Kalmusia sp. IMI 367209]